MTEDDRAALYWSLLRGIAAEAQNRMCAADKDHDWSPWHRTQLQRDVPLRLVPPDDMTAAMNETYRLRADRHCLNCGKTEMR